ncbi:sulfotransferase family protein [Nocardioides xinjiangensis]|uniref:sulfotransferase family protein n=1 Tax=Nocardioides xinjiangensis TaxID=2817376 RepID=UPI001B3122ED|nr:MULTISPECIES: sulfotransferase [unclassified Nocardioides]
MVETLFIVGPPRSGTSLLYKALCLHPDVAYLSNWVRRFPALPALGVLNRIPPILPTMRREAWFGDGTNAYVYGSPRSAVRRAFPAPVEGEPVFTRCGIDAVPGGCLPGSTPDLDRLRRTFHVVSTAAGGRVLISKRIAHNLRIPLLASAFESAKFVYLVRDGRAVAHSLSRVDWWLDSEVWWQRTTPRAWAEHGGDPWTLCARHWVEEVRAVEDGLSHVPSEQRMELRYEDMMADPLAVLGRVADFGDLPVSSVWRDELDRLQFPDRNKTWLSAMDDGVVSRVTQLQQPLLARYGYE